MPEHQDVDIEGIEGNISDRLVCALDLLARSTDEKFKETWSSLRRSLCVYMNVNHGHLEKVSMVQEFSNIRNNDILILHIVQQNAALIFRNESK